MTERKRAVRRTFDAIAEEFAATRRDPWPAVEDWVAARERGDVALDLGCGNGRHLPVLAERYGRPVGCDASRELLSLVPDRFATVRGDLNALPLEDGVADAAVCIAALHHLPDRETRLGALAEIARVLAPGRRCLVSVWAIEHPRFDGERDEIRSRGGDVTVPWTTDDGETHERFYHIYEREEFETDLAAAAPRTDRVWSHEGNHYAEIRADG